VPRDDTAVFVRRCILLYLAEKTGKFCRDTPKDARTAVLADVHDGSGVLGQAVISSTLRQRIE